MTWSFLQISSSSTTSVCSNNVISIWSKAKLLSTSSGQYWAVFSMEAPEKLNNYLKLLGCKASTDTICCCLFGIFYLLFVSLIMLEPGCQAVIIIAQHGKGQLILKCPFGVFKSPQKNNEIFSRISVLASKKSSNSKIIILYGYLICNFIFPNQKKKLKGGI